MRTTTWSSSSFSSSPFLSSSRLSLRFTSSLKKQRTQSFGKVSSQIQKGTQEDTLRLGFKVLLFRVYIDTLNRKTMKKTLREGGVFFLAAFSTLSYDNTIICVERLFENTTTTTKKEEEEEEEDFFLPRLYRRHASTPVQLRSGEEEEEEEDGDFDDGFRQQQFGGFIAQSHRYGP